MNRVSESVKKARLDNGISQKQLAKKLGVSESFINEVESGRKVINEATIIRLQNILKVNLNDINMYEEDNVREKVIEKPKPQIQTKKESKKIEPINEVWDDAFGSVIRNVPVFDYNMDKALAKISMPIFSNKIKGYAQDKVAYLTIEDEDMTGYRICKGDTAFIYLNRDIENSSICLLEYNGKRVIRQVKKLDGTKILLIKNNGSIKTETVNSKEIKILAKLISVEILLNN